MLWSMDKTFLIKQYKRWSKTSGNIQKTVICHGDDYISGCLLIMLIYKVIPLDLSKGQVLDGDPKANQQINFIGNLERDESRWIFFIMREQN